MMGEEQFRDFLGISDVPPLVRRIAAGEATLGDARDVLYVMLALSHAMEFLPGLARSIKTFERAQMILDREAQEAMLAERALVGDRDGRNGAA